MNIRKIIKKFVIWVFTLAILFYIYCFFGLVLLKFINPPTTTVQLQRHISVLLSKEPYSKQSDFVPLAEISLQLQRAVIAAEDGRFYQHNGVDWLELKKMFKNTQRTGEQLRGASTITQQLIKNMFFTTRRSYIRKLYEFSLAPVAELILSKERILELYLNLVEWGQGIFGAEAATQHYYNSSARWLTKWQSARLAAILPAPRTRSPFRMDWYASEIIRRMNMRGW